MSLGTAFRIGGVHSRFMREYSPLVDLGGVFVQLRLTCVLFYLDVRLREFNGRWLASADTPDGPSLGWAMSPVGALWMALEPFDGIIKSCSPGVADDSMAGTAG